MEHTTNLYTYGGKLWKASATGQGKDSFFHAVFGGRANESAPYIDKHAKVRRMRWAAFLTYFENETVHPALADVLCKCFSASEKYKNASLEDKSQLGNYAFDIMMSQQDVIVEEIPVLATLENIAVVVVAKDKLEPVIAVKPNLEIFGIYSAPPENPKEEVVLCLEGNIFSKLEVVKENCQSEFIRNDGVTASTSKEFREDTNQSYNTWSKYAKGGSAGSKGVDYQVGILTIFLLNSLRTLKNWRLSTENKLAGKFDDVVLESSEKAVLLQSKHKDNKTKKITLDDILSTNSKSDDFSLPKYFLSYLEIRTKFELKNIIICTNATIHGKAMKFLKSQIISSESMLFYGNDDKCKFYTLSDEILPDLKENIKIYWEKNSKKKNDQIVITEQDLKGFLKYLQFYCIYPPGNNVGKVMEELLSLSNSSTDICVYGQISASEIQNKVMDWFQQKDGVYLNEIYSKALFCEIWRDKRWQTLEEYHVQFQKTNFHFPDKKILHVNVANQYLLQELRICLALKHHKTKMLLMSSDNKLKEQKQILEAFSLPIYSFLIVIGPKITEKTILKGGDSTLKDTLEKYQYKKVIVVAEENELLQHLCLSNMDYFVMKESVKFQDFSNETQGRLLSKKVIVYQGEELSLEDFLAKEDIEKVLSSYVLEKLITNKTIDVGVKPLDLDEDVSRFYIERKFEKELSDGKVVQTITEEALYNENEKVILISDQAGTGKTTVLTKLAVTLKRKYSDMWVIKMELTDYTKILNDVLDGNRQVIDIVELMNSRYATKLRNRLENDIFSLGGKVVLMLDGLDEISPDYTELVLNMLVKICQEEADNFGKIFLTTRPHMTQSLEAELNVKSFKLYPFTSTDQTDFLTKYWAHNMDLDSSNTERCQEYAEALLKRIPRWVNSEGSVENHFAAIPLLIRMLAEIFQERHTREESDWQGCREFLGGTGIVPELPEEMDIVKLYEMFITKKRLVFIKKGNPSGNTVANRALTDQFEECLSYHRSLALELIVSKTKCHLFSDYEQGDENLEINLLKIGIVQKLDGEIHFIHRTFAEYFVAQVLFRELKLQNQNSEFQIFFIDEILFESTFRVTRAFLDGLLQNVIDDLPSTTFDSYQSITQKIQSSLREKNSLIHILAEEGCVAILKLLFKCIDFKVIRDQRIELTNFRQSYLQEGAVGNTLSILKDVVLQGGVNIYNDMGITPLRNAVRKGNLKMVNYLITQGANVNEGYLHEALENNYFEIIKLLVDQGADVKAKDNKKCSVLYVAISADHQNSVTYIFENILNSNDVDREYFQIPYAAAYLGRLDILKTSVERSLDVNCTVEYGETLIFGAARGRRSEVIEYLVQQGADINRKDDRENTALHIISGMSTHIGIAELLVKLGIDLNATDNNGFLALHIAAYEGNFPLVRKLVKDGMIVNADGDKLRLDVNILTGSGKTALYLAASNRHKDIVKFLVSCGADFNHRNEDGRTPLYAATFSHDLPIVTYFIELGVDIHDTDNYGRTLLHSAAFAGQLDTVKFLLKLGVRMNLRDHEGCTPLYLAAMWGHFNVMRYLADHGADVTIGDHRGLTPLQLVSGMDHLRTIEVLVRHGAEVNCEPDSGCTPPLHVAILRKRFNTVKFLLHHGANVNFKNNEGRTALHLATAENLTDIVQLLLEHGADPDVRDNTGRLALEEDRGPVLVGVQSCNDQTTE